MDALQTVSLCQEVERAAAQVRSSIGDRTEMAEVLDRFWELHDTLDRLVEVVSDGFGDPVRCRKVISTVLGAIESPAAKKRSYVPGVRDSLEKINDLLMALEHATTLSVFTSSV